MTMTETETTPLEAAQERLAAIEDEMEQLQHELQDIPAAVATARRREDVTEAMRLQMRAENIKERHADLTIARMAAEATMLDAKHQAARAEAKARAEAMVLERQEYDQMEQALMKKRQGVHGAFLRSQAGHSTADDIGRQARDAWQRHGDLVAGRRTGGA